MSMKEMKLQNKIIKLVSVPMFSAFCLKKTSTFEAFIAEVSLNFSQVD